MSINVHLRHASPFELARLVRDGIEPSDLGRRSNGRGNASMSRLERWEQKLQKEIPGSISPASRRAVETARKHVSNHLAVMRQSPGTPSKTRRSRLSSPILDLHKSWQMLHFAFTGEAWGGPAPAATLLVGGRPIGADMGYGPARIVSAADTDSFARFLAGLNVPTLSESLDLSAMHQLGIYCVEDDDPNTLVELTDDLGDHFPALQAYVADAAEKQHGLIIWMT
jgi:hypothetical protein